MDSVTIVVVGAEEMERERETVRGHCYHCCKVGG